MRNWGHNSYFTALVHTQYLDNMDVAVGVDCRILLSAARALCKGSSQICLECHAPHALQNTPGSSSLEHIHRWSDTTTRTHLPQRTRTLSITLPISHCAVCRRHAKYCSNCDTQCLGGICQVVSTYVGYNEAQK